MAEGRAISNLNEVAQKGMKERESIMVAKSLLGSRPPKCERRCRNCGHCEAVQVPVAPQVQSHRSHYSAATRTAAIASYSRGDGLSNYKPISWKCKCGDYFFNP
ncbi:Epidermal patterning factor protein [Sesbania bispinosa]|nr:Epidermal patterning factor protein [Sesbania bispinosa]